MKNFKLFEEGCLIFFDSQEGPLRFFTLTGLQKCHKVINTVHQRTVGTICVHTTFMIA